MKKILIMMALAASVTGVAFASPQTSFKEGQTEINVGMWDAEAHSNGYKSDGEWNFLGGVTYGINEKWAAQYQYTGLHTDHTDGNMNEINALYSFHPQVAGFVGWNRIYMKDFPKRAFGSDDQINNIAQLGIIARQPINDVVDVYAKGALGTEQTSMWEAGVNLALDKNVDLNAGYHYLNTKGDSENNVSYKGFIAGVSYRFGGKDHTGEVFEEAEPNLDYEAQAEEPSVVTISSNQGGPATTVEVPADEPVKAPENDYYMNSVHFDSDSAALTDSQKANLKDFIAKAKETGHTFKLVGRADPTGSADYNKELASRRIESVKAYAVSQGVDSSKLIPMVKGAEGATGPESRRVDVFEHK
ncbi:OmpA family protein [Dialister sp.]|uniref:OmpA family protein n=1 Tax=Dialister sp. TaxID=1955814 RepID=UPI002E82315C|nr:OmpA family protein [Dialister sp.]MEE3453542.1 OmpA family protein [Dialister sp.]